MGDPDKYAQALANSYNVEPQLVIDAYNYSKKDARALIVVPVPILSAGPVNETLVEKGKTLMAQAVTAKPEEFDAVWDAGIADWLASGAQDVVNERTEKYFEVK